MVPLLIRVINRYLVLLLVAIYKFSTVCSYTQPINKEDMLTLSCKDVGFDCNHLVKAGTEEEVIRNITEHAIKKHGMKAENMTPKMKEIIRKFIHNSS